MRQMSLSVCGEGIDAGLLGTGPAVNDLWRLWCYMLMERKTEDIMEMRQVSRGTCCYVFSSTCPWNKQEGGQRILSESNRVNPVKDDGR